MTIALPAPLPAYFAAKNEHDIDAMLAAFAPQAVVRDEGHDMAGTDAIRAWIAETTRKYAVTVAPTGVRQVDGRTIVTALVSGNFPGSPAELTYRFTIDGAKISALEIGT